MFIEKGRGIKLQFVFMLIGMVWTGILLYVIFTQQSCVNQIENQINSWAKKIGMHSSKAIEYAVEEDEKNRDAWKKFYPNAALGYMYENETNLVRVTDDTVTKLAGHFAGQGTNNIFWSTAGSHFYRFEVAFGKEVTNNKVQDNKQEEQTQQTITTVVPKEEQTNKEVIACDSKEQLQSNLKKIQKLEKSMSRSYLLKNFYITDSSTTIDNSIFQVRKLLTKSMKLEKEKKPQILIFHTHGASEAFRDSRKGKKEDTIVGVGATLAKELTDTYGYQVIHDQTQYDRIHGKIDRSKAYNYSCKGVIENLKKYPSIEVVIDLHRDGVGNKVKRTTVVDGKKTAQIMFFNGLSRNSSGNIAYLHNENLQGNLAFSLQLKLACMRRFQNLAKPVYLKGYRYNMHLKERFTLIELGNENNTLAEEKNATKPLAMVLDCVLQGKK